MNEALVCNAANQDLKATATDKVLTILNDVVGIDTAKYKISLEAYNQDLFFEILPQENVKYILESEESKLEVICTFVNGKLHSMAQYILEGSPHMLQTTTDALKIAKNFLSKYQAYCEATYYETMKTMLDGVNINENITIKSESIKFKAEHTKSFIEWENRTADIVELRWTYLSNNVEAPSKCVAMYFEQDLLKYFVDTWNLYKIGNSTINISEEEAVKIARVHAKNFSWNVSMGSDNPQMEVTEFNIAGVSRVTLDFGNYITKEDARGGDPLTLYPCWHIQLYLDKIYPGNVYGIDVGIWADTGEVNDIRALISGLGLPLEEHVTETSPNEYNSQTNLNTQVIIITVPISILIMLLAIKLYSRRKKREPHEFRPNPLKFSAALSCFLILSTILTSTPTVNAGTYVIGLYGSTWKVITQEQNAAKSVIDSIEYWFGNYASYTCYDLYGSLTQKQTVLDHASAFEQYFDHVAMFHHGHGGMSMEYPQQHRDYFDDDGPEPLSNQIWDYEIGLKTWRSKHFFVILWACRQGDHVGEQNGPLGVYGMPYAWHNPISSGDCFIGFKDASMPLTQKSIHYPYHSYSSWLVYFIYYLTYHHYTIMQSLDYASIECLQRSYYATELDDGFYAIWPGFGNGAGWMKIYGNPNIQVY
ncbi:MAG: hypothetical protein QXJ40_04090 [Candidatus Bathyarchaeia archaeon]